MQPEMNTQDTISTVPWRPFIITTIESLIAFYIATFCLAIVITHRTSWWKWDLVFLGALYIFVIIACAWRVLHKLSLATVMLIIPIAPFIALAIVISMIPLVQLFR